MNDRSADFLHSWRERGSPTLENVRPLQGEGPYETKAGADLLKLLQLAPEACLEDFLQFTHSANVGAVPDLRSLRVYSVTGQASGRIGGTEFHRQRQEIVFCIGGSFDWVCEDLHGATRTYELKPGSGVWMPPFILHTFTATSENSDLIVICNTRYDKMDEGTHDTWTTEVFRDLQAAASSSNQT